MGNPSSLSCYVLRGRGRHNVSLQAGLINAALEVLAGLLASAWSNSYDVVFVRHFEISRADFVKHERVF